ncbi:MAG: hypothetical protein KBA15_09040, partial [Spirochaetes bacterium]|nr:hypothetical protein [Spirochaetota bacterium]
MQDAKKLLAATRRARGVPAPIEGSHRDSPFSALRNSDTEEFGKWLIERGKRLLETVPASEPVQAPAVSELDAFEAKARAAARRLTEFKNDSGKTVVRGGNGVIVVGP